jgi:hypothetical protein
MKPFIVFFYIIIAAIILAQCASPQPIQANSPTRTPAAEFSPTPRPTSIPTLTALPATPTTQPMPKAIGYVKEFLTRKLGVQPGDIHLVNYTAVEWPDACLGIQTPGIMCAMVVTPGYKVFLKVGGKLYELHSNQTGQSVRLVEDRLNGGNPVIVWQSAGQPCQQATLTALAVIYGDCQAGPRKMGAYVSLGRQADLLHFVRTFTSFAANTPSGTVIFVGEGDVKASAAQQRSIAEWARLVFSEVRARRSEAAWGLAFSFSRYGGIAGFSDDLRVYPAGYALITTRSSDPAPRKVYLNDAQLKQLYYWLDTFKPVDYDQSSPANVSDGMSITLSLSGAGKKVASDQDIKDMLDFASRLAIENR